MIQHLDRSLEDFLRAEVPLQRADVDIVFDPPDNEWRAGLTKPTLNLFLWDMRLSPAETHAGRSFQRRADGTTVFSEESPRVSFRYLVTAWTTEVVDEHRLLGLVLQTLLPSRTLPERHLAGPLGTMKPPPSIHAARPQSKDFAEFWSAIDGKLKPGIDLQLIATVDAAAYREAGPPTEELGIVLDDKRSGARGVSEHRIVAGEVADPDAVGAVVRSPRGSTTVDENGRFRIAAFPGDQIVVETPDPKTAVVGADGIVTLA